MTGQALDRLPDLLGPAGWHALTVFLRVAALMAVLPVFGERSVPMRVRLGLALAFTAIVAPAVPVDPAARPGLGPLLHLAGTETAAGLLLGLMLRLMVLALQTAGAIAAQSTSLSQLLGGAGSDPLPAMGHVLLVGGLALAAALDLHVRAAELLVLSYDLLPAGHWPDPADVAQLGVARISAAFALGFGLAAPFVILSMLYNLTLGVINRAMPQLMVAFVGAPVITLGGLFLLFLVSPLLLTVWVRALFAVIADPVAAVP